MSIGAGKKVLITGASGFVAAWVVREFLEHGYHVIGTVRSQDKAEAVRKQHPEQYADKLDFRIVGDIAEPDAFDEAVKDVDGVIHTASPFVLEVKDNEKDLLIPALHGTQGVLKSIKKNNPNVKRVVVTSSFAAILDMDKGPRPDHTYSEADWNPATYDSAKNNGGSYAYCASKKIAEKAAFDFVEQEKPNFDVATICPPMIYGPNSHPVESMSKLNTSSADIYRLINGSSKEVPDTAFFAWVDVREVATAHRLAYEKSEAAGQRYFVTGGPYSYQEICDIVRKHFPEIKDKVPEGKPGSGNGGVKHYDLDNSKSRKLGVEYRSLEQSMIDTTKNLLELEKRTGGK